MRWSPISDPPKTYPLNHIHPFTFAYQHKGNTINIEVKFGHHTFTDEKGDGVPITVNKEERYFCPDRYDLSFELPGIIQKELVQSYLVAYRNRKGGEQFFTMTINEVAIFFSLHKKGNTENTLKLMIISAYEVAEWGKSSLPRGKVRLKWDDLVFRRLNNNRIL